MSKRNSAARPRAAELPRAGISRISKHTISAPAVSTDTAGTDEGLIELSEVEAGDGSLGFAVNGRVNSRFSGNPLPLPDSDNIALSFDDRAGKQLHL